jgi:hypothetical protein
MLKRLMIGVTLLLTACGAADVPIAGPDPGQVVIVVESTGGCAQMGPNCTRLVIFGDGTVEAYRFVIDGEELVDIGMIDPELAAELQTVLATTDLDALRARLPAGHCRGCFDGIDTTMTFPGAGGPEVFGSIEVELDPSEPVFAGAWAVAAVAEAATEVPFASR